MRTITKRDHTGDLVTVEIPEFITRSQRDKLLADLGIAIQGMSIVSVTIGVRAVEIKTIARNDEGGAIIGNDDDLTFETYTIPIDDDPPLRDAQKVEG